MDYIVSQADELQLQCCIVFVQGLHCAANLLISAKYLSCAFHSIQLLVVDSSKALPRGNHDADWRHHR